MQQTLIVLGNKASWAARIRRQHGHQHRFDPEPLHAGHAGTAEIVLPLTLTDYDILAADQRFSGKALFPSPQAVAICNDKQRFRDWFCQRFDPGWLPGPPRDCPVVIAKQRVGEWGTGARLIDGRNGALIETLLRDPAMVVEEYVAGAQERACHLLCVDGQVRFSALSIYEHASPLHIQGRHGRPARGAIAPIAEPPAIFTGIAAALGFTGSACIDYKLDEHGRIRIFEFNPRFGGSLAWCFAPYLAQYIASLRGR